MEDLKQLETDSLVRSARDRVVTTVPSKSGGTMKPGTASMRGSLLRPMTSERVEEMLQPMTLEQAGKLVRRLLAGYPNLGTHDPEAYIAALVETMAQYPLWAGQQSIVKVDVQNASFPPTEKELRSWLDDAVSPYKFRKEWDERLEKQFALRAAFEGAAKPTVAADPNIKSYSHSGFDDAVRAHGRPIGVFESGRDRPYRG